MSRILDPDDAHGWLAKLFSLPTRDVVLAGVNDDDCAVMQWDDSLLILTTDFLNASPIAVELGIGNFEDLGRLVVASSISDLCGSGADPRALLLGAMLEHGTAETVFQSLMTGAKDAAATWKVDVIGGDTKLGHSRALFCVGIGSAKSRANLFLKNAAKPGDLLWCSGPLGSCAAATLGLSKHKVGERWAAWAKNAILHPEVPLPKSRNLSIRELGHGGIDISDGLGSDIHKLCRASNTGVVIDASRIPVDAHVAEFAAIAGIEPWSFAFGSGGDGQFLVTTEPSVHDEVATLGMHLIGRLTDELKMDLRIGARTVPVPSRGHRDVHGLSFTEEIATLLRQLPQKEP